MRKLDGDKLIATVKINTVRFYNAGSNFGIISFTVLDYESNSEVIDVPGRTVAKGIMPEPIKGATYHIEAKEVLDPKWGKQYNIDRLYSSLFVNEDDTKAQKCFLESLFTEKQIESMYESLKDPYKALKDKDVQALVSISGCGFKTASRWIQKFHENLNNSKVYVELAQYNFSAKMIDKLIQHYKSPDLVINIVKTNPYKLMEVSGVGWKTCDEIAQKGNMDRHCPERVQAFLFHHLRTKAEEGYTYLYANEQLMAAIIETLGDDIPDAPILEALKQLEDKLWWNQDHILVGLKSYVMLERKIAEKLIELRNSKNNFEYVKWQWVIKEQEARQGWKYTDQQIEGIKAVLENQVVVITGAAGCGKSSIVAGMLEILKKYSCVQCALSGRAAARLSEVTQLPGYTIHRLLGFPNGDENHQKYVYHEENPLPADIVVVDEFSMVSGDLFWVLIRALKPGTKLILLGDVGQLESIGSCNLINDMLKSPEIPSIALDKIHRQAEDSAIIMESMSARKGMSNVPRDYAGVIVKGKLQDLTYDCFSDINCTFYKILEYASELKSRGCSVLDSQVIVPMKDRQAGTNNLNLALQEIYNPLEGREELVISYSKDLQMPMRVGDKVINTRNNYGACTYVGQWLTKTKEEAKEMGEPCPIFNGNIGIVKAINLKRNELIVDFLDIGTVLVEQDRLKDISLGYAVTVHKYQGSEVKNVIFGVDFSAYALLTRQMIYTGITRAKSHCYVVAQTSAFRYAVAQNGVSKKQTLLQDMLHDVAHPKMIF